MSLSRTEANPPPALQMQEISESNPGPLQEQPLLLTTEPLSQRLPLLWACVKLGKDTNSSYPSSPVP